MAIDFGMFLRLFAFLAVTTCCCPPLSTRVVEENEVMLNMAEDLQLEVQSNIYAADGSSLERMAQFFKAEYEGKSKLSVAKRVAEQLEVEISKLKESKVVPYLEDVKKILIENPSSGIKSSKSVPSDSKPPSTAKEDSVQKLLATSTLRRQFKISGQIGNPSRKIKLVSLHWHVKFKRDCLRVMMRAKLLMVLFVRLLRVWYLEVISKLTKS